MPKAQPLYPEPHIDYSESQLPAFNGLYVDPISPAVLSEFEINMRPGGG